MQKKSKPEQMFDTKSGIRLAGLRATLGLSEGYEDQIEKIVNNQYILQIYPDIKSAFKF